MKYLTRINLRVYFGSPNRRQIACLSGEDVLVEDSKRWEHISAEQGAQIVWEFGCKSLKPTVLVTYLFHQGSTSYVFIIPPPGIAPPGGKQAFKCEPSGDGSHPIHNPVFAMNLPSLHCFPSVPQRLFALLKCPMFCTSLPLNISFFFSRLLSRFPSVTDYGRASQINPFFPSCFGYSVLS